MATEQTQACSALDRWLEAFRHVFEPLHDEAFQ